MTHPLQQEKQGRIGYAGTHVPTFVPRLLGLMKPGQA